MVNKKSISNIVGVLASPKVRSILLSVAVIALVLFSLYKDKFLGSLDVRPGPTDLSLSGTWKIRYSPLPDARDPKFNDDHWCLISVPDSGIRPSFKNTSDSPAADCPKDYYPVDLMRHHTYWYRKEIIIPRSLSWRRPTLFLGSVKHQGTVFWDGAQIGTAHAELSPAVFTLDTAITSVGRHVLAVRVVSESDGYPGIYHSLERGVTIGEFDQTVAAVNSARKIDYIEPTAIIILQFAALLVVFYLMIRSPANNESFKWLVLYFGSSCLFSAAYPLRDEWKWYFTHISIIGSSISLSGYGALLFSRTLKSLSLADWVLLSLGTVGAIFETLALKHADPNWMGAGVVYKVLSVYSLFFICVLGANALSNRSKRSKYFFSDYCLIFSLFVLHTLPVCGQVLAFDRAVDIHENIACSLLTVLVIVLTIEEHVRNEIDLGFFGRFIRPGLRQLLVSNYKKNEMDQRWYRGRKIPVLKIDIVGHTDRTYGMPYGAKRIYQNTWFSLVDQIFEGKVFLDRGEGDGSFYYFDPYLEQGCCSAAFKSAVFIQETVVDQFDAKFKEVLSEKMRSEPDLKIAMDRFSSSFFEKTGDIFWDQKTRVRAVLLYGYADDGLWGNYSQSHYDVQGDIVTLAARLEKSAGADEIILTEEFLARLLEEAKVSFDHSKLEWREANLKGIGKKSFGVLKLKKHASLAA